MKKLAGNRSPNWAFLQPFAVPDYDSDDTYLWRLRIVQTPLFGVYLHKLGTPDPRDTLHDHPWPFVSIVLRGGYDEMRRRTHDISEEWWDADRKIIGYAYRHRVRFLNWMPMDALHWIERLHRTPTWTLVFVGRRQRVWQYMDRDGTLTDFDKHAHNEAFEAAMARRRS